MTSKIEGISAETVEAIVAYYLVAETGGHTVTILRDGNRSLGVNLRGTIHIPDLIQKILASGKVVLKAQYDAVLIELSEEQNLVAKLQGDVVLRKDVEAEAKTILDWWAEEKRLRKIKDEHPYNYRSGPVELARDYYRADNAWNICYNGQRVEMLERAVAILAKFTTKQENGNE